MGTSIREGNYHYLSMVFKDPVHFFDRCDVYFFIVVTKAYCVLHHC